MLARENLEKIGENVPVCIHTPLLHGLEEKGFVSAYEREATAGKPRRYYHLTQEGHRALHEKEEAWNVYARAVGQVLKGGACCAGA